MLLTRQKGAKKNQGLTFRFSIPQAKLEKLQEIEDPVDRRLQQLLWELGCEFDLFPHQFLGVRTLAGLADEFPGESMLKFTPPMRRTDARILALKDAKPRREGDHGVILADSMGLGKTVQTVAAIILYDAVAAAKGETPMPAIISSPNEAVRNQWEQHLIQGGVEARRIVKFKPKCLRSLPKDDTIFICTRYDFQTEAKHIFEELPQLKRGDIPSTRPFGKSSPLFPFTPQRTLHDLYNQYKQSKGEKKSKIDEELFRKKITNEVAVTRHLKKAGQDMSSDGASPIVFRMVVIDEAVSCQSVACAFWG